jgi:hypothetical protein
MANRADYRGALQTSPLASAMVARPPAPPPPSPFPQQIEPNIRELVQSLDPSSTVREGEYTRSLDPNSVVREGEYVRDSYLPMPPVQEGGMLENIVAKIKQFQESNQEKGELATLMGRLTGENPENFAHLSLEEMRLQLQAIEKAIEPPAITSQ